MAVTSTGQARQLRVVRRQRAAIAADVLPPRGEHPQLGIVDVAADLAADVPAHAARTSRAVVRSARKAPARVERHAEPVHDQHGTQRRASTELTTVLI